MTAMYFFSEKHYVNFLATQCTLYYDEETGANEVKKISHACFHLLALEKLDAVAFAQRTLCASEQLQNMCQGWNGLFLEGKET